MSSEKVKNITLLVYLPPEEKENLKARANALGLNYSQYVRELVRWDIQHKYFGTVKGGKR